MKHCIMCGCLMDDKHEGDICECCVDELLESEIEVVDER